MGISFNQDQEKLYFSNDHMELSFCKRTGQWLGVKEQYNGQQVMDHGNRLSTVQIIYGGKTTVTRMRRQMWSIKDSYTVGPSLVLEDVQTKTEDGTEWLTLITTEGSFKVYQSYGLKQDSDRLCRRIGIRWTGEDEILLRKVVFHTPALEASERNVLEAPGYPHILHKKLNTLPMGQWNLMMDAPDMDAPAGRAGVLGINHKDYHLLLWGFNDKIPSTMQVERCAWGVILIQSLYASCRLKPNQLIDVGCQYMRMNNGDFKNTLAGMQQFWEEVDVRVPNDLVSWSKRAKIFELHIGEMDILKGPAHTPYPTFQDVMEDLPRIANMGFNCIEIMPQFPFPSYSVHDFMNVEIQYGISSEQLRELVEQSHQYDMKVMVDIIMHGVTDKTLNPDAIYDKHPLLEQHPEWFCLDEYGELGKTYTWAFDHAHPGFQKYMRDVCLHYVKAFDLDGFRVDALNWNTFPNWNKELDYPAYFNFYGTEEMYRMIREAVHQVKPDVVFYTETAGPLYFRSYDLSYNYDEHWLFDDLLPLKTTKKHFSLKMPKGWEANAIKMAEWLELRKLAFPKGFIRAHHADSHDSFTWGHHGQFKKDVYGEDGGRLYFALCSLLDGGVMTYAGAEKGSEAYYRKILNACKQIKAISEGSCDYVAVQSQNEKVFSMLYQTKDSWAIPVLSFSDERETTVLIWDSMLEDSKSYTLCEWLSGEIRTGTGEELKKLKLELSPYAVQVWKGEIAND